MKKIKPILAKKHPYLWKQAIRNTPFRGYSLRNFILHPIIEHCFSFKHHHSYYFDHLIIGSNPILASLILSQLHSLTLLESERPLRIGLFFTDEQDYWGYHALEKPDIWKQISSLFNLNITNFKDFLEQQPLSFNSEKHELIIVNSTDMSLLNCRYDSYMDGYVLNASDKIVYTQHGYQNHMPHVMKEETRLAQHYKSIFLEHLHHLSLHPKNSIQELIFPLEKHTSEDCLIPTHLILSKRIWITSQPQQWLASEVIHESHSITYHEHSYTETLFSNMATNYSFGSAVHIANTFEGLEEQSYADMAHLYLNPITSY